MSEEEGDGQQNDCDVVDQFKEPDGDAFVIFSFDGDNDAKDAIQQKPHDEDQPGVSEFQPVECEPEGDEGQGKVLGDFSKVFCDFGGVVT